LLQFDCHLPSLPAMTSTLPSRSLNQHRQLFPALANKAYFNYGGQGTLPTSALTAIQQAQVHMQEIGPFSSAVNRWVMQQMQQMRAAIGSELGVPAATITLTEDVTVGCNIALWGTNWQAGDHLLLSDCEHPGIVAAAREIGRRFQVEVSICPLRATLNQGDPVAVIAEHLRPTTRLLVISHILWNTGQVLPLQQIMQLCHRAQPSPVRVLVDAAQSVGMMPLDLDALDVDFYAFTGHKWLCGPAGIGGLYVSAAALDSITPTFIGWRGITKDHNGQLTAWQPDSSRFEVATSDYALYAALEAALATHQQWGTAEARFERILSLSQFLWQRLNELPWITCLRSAPPESGLVSFQVQNPTATTHARLVQFLEQQGFFLRTILDPDCVRACVHYLTTEGELEQLVETIGRFEANL
jgi:L-cysteine/cystine lyase